MKRVPKGARIGLHSQVCSMVRGAAICGVLGRRRWPRSPARAGDFRYLFLEVQLVAGDFRYEFPTSCTKICPAMRARSQTQRRAPRGPGDSEAAERAANREHHTGLVEELRARIAAARPPAEAVERQKAQGKLPVRERIAQL